MKMKIINQSATQESEFEPTIGVVFNSRWYESHSPPTQLHDEKPDEEDLDTRSRVFDILYTHEIEHFFLTALIIKISSDEVVS